MRRLFSKPTKQFLKIFTNNQKTSSVNILLYDYITNIKLQLWSLFNWCIKLDFNNFILLGISKVRYLYRIFILL